MNFVALKKNKNSWWNKKTKFYIFSPKENFYENELTQAHALKTDELNRRKQTCFANELNQRLG